MAERRPLLVANWKMHKTVAESVAFVRQWRQRLEAEGNAGAHDREVVVCPTLPALWPCFTVLDGSPVGLGAQNLDLGREGPVTGAVSGYLLAEAGARYVIVGHSERRSAFGEDDALVAEKVQAALEVNLSPIVCVGEPAEVRAAGRTDAWLERQVTAFAAGLGAADWGRVVVAYEPIWAIGSGQVPEPVEAGRVAARIRGWLGAGGAQARVLYGGSVQPGNLAEFWRHPEIDGALVGGASLDLERFWQMAHLAW